MVHRTDMDKTSLTHIHDVPKHMLCTKRNKDIFDLIWFDLSMIILLWAILDCQGKSSLHKHSCLSVGNNLHLQANEVISIIIKPIETVPEL